MITQIILLLIKIWNNIIIIIRAIIILRHIYIYKSMNINQRSNNYNNNNR